jgi:hypothetical protein
MLESSHDRRTKMNSDAKLVSIMMLAQAVQQSWDPGRIMVSAVHFAFLSAGLKCRIPMCVELKFGAESNTMISKDGQ